MKVAENGNCRIPSRTVFVIEPNCPFLFYRAYLSIKWPGTLFTLLAIYKKFVSLVAPLFFAPPTSTSTSSCVLAAIRIVVKLYFVVLAFLRHFLVFPAFHVPRLAPFLLVKVEPELLPYTLWF